MNDFDTPVKAIEIDGYSYKLQWVEDLGFGFLMSDGYDYGEEYWQKYQSYINDLGAQLSNARANFVLKNLGNYHDVCDVGVGSGQFVDTIKCKGYDVNPFANEWLKAHGYYADPYAENFNALCFWDVLEHIIDSSALLGSTEHVFVSVPIHVDLEACLASKHLRPGEHIWHFTDRGIKNFMALAGFECVDQSDFETKLGREDILSYFFKKRHK